LGGCRRGAASRRVTAATQTKPAGAGFHTPSFFFFLVKQAQGKFGVAISLATSGCKAIHT